MNSRTGTQCPQDHSLFAEVRAVCQRECWRVCTQLITHSKDPATRTEHRAIHRIYVPLLIESVRGECQRLPAWIKRDPEVCVMPDIIDALQPEDSPCHEIRVN